MESTLTSHLISPAASARACSLSAVRARCRHAASVGRAHRPSARARTPTADPSTKHRSSPANGSRRSASAVPPMACPASRPAASASARPTARQKDPLAPHRDHHGAGRAAKPTSKTRPSGRGLLRAVTRGMTLRNPSSGSSRSCRQVAVSRALGTGTEEDRPGALSLLTGRARDSCRP